jgi:hypothetical protein
MKRWIGGLLAAGAWAVPAFAAYDGSPPLIVANGGTGFISCTAHGVVLGEGTAALACTAVGTNGQMFLGATGADPGWQTMGGDATLGTTGTLTLATVNSNVGSFTNASITVNAKGLITAAATGAITVPTLLNYTTSNATVTLGATNLETVAFNQSGTKATVINLPASPAANLRKCIKDAGNDFAANSPTVKTTDSNTIDAVAGATGKTMNQTKQELCFIADSGTNWNIE